MKCTREIRWNNNKRCYTFQNFNGTPEELLAKMVEHLIKHEAKTFKPRVKPWQFWREKMGLEITNEYIKQTGEKS